MGTTICAERGLTQNALTLTLFKMCGFVEECEPDSQWEQYFRQALVQIFAPSVQPSSIEVEWDLQQRFGYHISNPRFLEQFQRLSGCPLRPEPDLPITSLAECQRFLKTAAPDLYPTPPTLPAIVIAGPPFIGSRPDWLHFFWHQIGGRLVSSQQFCGAILPLRQNRSFAFQDPTELFQAFDAMAEAPVLELIGQRYPSLLDMVLTLANPYSQPQLERLSNFVSTYFRLPAFAAGLEAMVPLQDCHPLHYFSD